MHIFFLREYIRPCPPHTKKKKKNHKKKEKKRSKRGINEHSWFEIYYMSKWPGVVTQAGCEFNILDQMKKIYKMKIYRTMLYF